MLGTRSPPALSFRGRRRPRGLSTVTAAIVLVIVVVLAGAVAFVLGSLASSSPQVRVTCAPASRPACASTSAAHDLRVLVPFATVQEGTLVPFTALLPTGAGSNAFAFNFGDGTPPLSGAGATVDHAYSAPGTYLVQVSALIGGTTHDNYHALAIVSVVTSGAINANGNLPTVAGTLVANTTSAVNPTAVLQPGGNATFSGSYTSVPTNPSWTAQPPTLVATSPATATAPVVVSAGTATGTFVFPTAGTYAVRFEGSALGPGGAREWQNYTWTVFVAPAGVHAAAATANARADPHPGTIIAYELQPGGAFSLDPAIDFDFAGIEPIMNLYQTLIFYNHNVTGPGWQSYTPQIATCVPGSPECLKLYGSPLVSANGLDYTFVINRASRFYDPATGGSWPVYPSDVLFTFARDASFANLPCVGCGPAWIQVQSFLPNGSFSWDNGIHAPYNNTPQAFFGSIAVNDTAAGCPQVALTQDHGCVTFHANGGGQGWPDFLEFIADPYGGAVLPCGWTSGTAPKSGQAGIPYWTSNPGATALVTGSGDHPCLLPGGATSTGDPRFVSAVNNIPITGWDQFQNQCSGAATGAYCGTIQTSGVGSGPYYLKSYSPGLSYAMQANPAYAQNPYCRGPDCEPPPGKYAKTVEVTWESDATIGEQAYRAGVADFATVPSTDTGLLLQLEEAGSVGALIEPTLGLGFYPFILNFSRSAAQTYSTNPVTIPGDWFGYLGMRQFFVHAYPYATAEATVNTKDGIVYGFNYGGMIPQFLANYYPTNISWPSGDPCSDASNPNCAVYWWQQMHSPSSPYYDPEVLHCSAASPCQFPILGWTGIPDIDARLSLLESSVKTLSGGAIDPATQDVGQTDLCNAVCYGPPGQSAVPMYEWGWYPDYPDPSDYARAMYLPDNSYTYGDAVGEQLSLNNSSACPRTISYYVDLAKPVSNACQGAAYWAMVQLINTAGAAPLGPNRVLMYNMMEHIANQLALYISEQQINAVLSFSSWIRPASIDTNVILVGSYTWYSIAGTSVWYPGSA